MTYASKRDGNEAGLIQLWRAAGCCVIQMDRAAGFDLLVVSPRNGLHVVEVKDPRRPRRRTEAETATEQELEQRGVVYNVITNEAEALKLVEAL